VNAVLDHAGLERMPLVSGYSGDSSFRGNREKPVFSIADRMFMSLCRLTVTCLPYAALLKWRRRHDRKSVRGIPRSARLAARAKAGP